MVACSGLVSLRDVSGLGKQKSLIILVQEIRMGTKEMLSSADTQNADIF